MAAKSGSLRCAASTIAAGFGGEQNGVEPFVIPAFRQRPTDAFGLRQCQVFMDRAERDRATARDLFITQFEFESEAKDSASFRMDSLLAGMLTSLSRGGLLASMMSSAATFVKPFGRSRRPFRA